MTITTILEEFDKVMQELPVNDYRVMHRDLNGENMPTYRGATIRDFIRTSIQSLLEDIEKEIEMELKLVCNSTEDTSKTNSPFEFVQGEFRGLTNAKEIISKYKK